jgi:16S rRNA (cytidine1402-2'-O)-methyltransferase
MCGTLYVVGGPIGNSKDASPFFIDTVKNAKHLVIEQIDIFLDQIFKMGINKPNGELIPIGYDIISTTDRVLLEKENLNKILSILKNGEDVYLVSDEGMPGISDPGGIIIKEVIKNNINIYSTPGPSSIISAAITAGCTYKFSYEGFLSNENDVRILQWKELTNRVYPMIFLIKNLEPNNIPNSEDLFSDYIFDFLKEAMIYFGNNRKGVLMYNLSTDNKKHKQHVFRGSLYYLYEHTKNNKRISGNSCIVIDGTNSLLP